MGEGDPVSEFVLKYCFTFVNFKKFKWFLTLKNIILVKRVTLVKDVCDLVCLRTFKIEGFRITIWIFEAKISI